MKADESHDLRLSQQASLTPRKANGALIQAEAWEQMGPTAQT